MRRQRNGSHAKSAIRDPRRWLTSRVCNRMYPSGIRTAIRHAVHVRVVHTHARRPVRAHRMRESPAFFVARSTVCPPISRRRNGKSQRYTVSPRRVVSVAGPQRNRHVLLHTNTPVIPPLSRVRSHVKGRHCHETNFRAGPVGPHPRECIGRLHRRARGRLSLSRPLLSVARAARSTLNHKTRE